MTERQVILKWFPSCVMVTDRRAAVRVALRATGWTGAEVARAAGNTENSPTLAVLASSKAWRKVVGAPGSGWETPARRSASSVEVGVPSAVMVVTSHTSLLP